MNEWEPPAELPDLRNVDIAAVDIEAKDDGLRDDRGSGWPYGAGYITGISVAWHTESKIRAHYISIRHPDSANFDRAKVIRWLRDLFASEVRIITHHGLYDYGWL